MKFKPYEKLTKEEKEKFDKEFEPWLQRDDDSVWWAGDHLPILEEAKRKKPE